MTKTMVSSAFLGHVQLAVEIFTWHKHQDMDVNDCRWGFPKKIPTASLSKTGTHVFVLKMFVVDMFAQQAFISTAQPWKVSWHVRRRHILAWVSCIIYKRLYECFFSVFQTCSDLWGRTIGRCLHRISRPIFRQHMWTSYFYMATPTGLISFNFAMLFSSTTLFYAIKFDSRTQSPALRKRRRTPEKFDVALGSH